ncbi:MAG TPA: FAD-dependent oxidoreductase, partial [Kribbella sp.]|nr:FAD-dependent oxidoreductase [Kribbella sp.]
MKRLVILGAGTAGTTVANKLRRRLPLDEWRITVVDRDGDHLYQPGLLFVPFGGDERHLFQSRRKVLRNGILMLQGEIVKVDPQAKDVRFADG